MREMSCSATRTVMSERDMERRYSITWSLYFMSRWAVGSSTSMSLGSWTYAFAMSALCLSPDEHRDSCLFLIPSRPKVLSASLVILSSSGDSHHRRST